MDRRDNLKKRVPFKKGDERINREGRPKKLPELDILLAECFGNDEMEKVLKALYQKAIKGDVRAAEVILSRAYGQAKQPIDLSGKIQTENTLTFEKGKEIASELKDKY